MYFFSVYFCYKNLTATYPDHLNSSLQQKGSTWPREIMAVKCKPSQYHCFRSSLGPDSKWHETELIINCSRKQYERQVYFTLLFLLHLLSPGLRSPATSYSCSYYWPSHLPSLFFLPGVEASAYACPDSCRAASKGCFPLWFRPWSPSPIGRSGRSTTPPPTPYGPEHPSPKPSSLSAPTSQGNLKVQENNPYSLPPTL